MSRRFSSTGAHVPSTPGGTRGFQRLNISGPSVARNSPQPPSFSRPKTVSSSEPMIENDRLQRLGVGHRAHAAEDRIQASQHDHSTEPIQKLSTSAAELQTRLRQQRAEDDAAGEDADGDLGDDVGNQRDDRQHVPRASGEKRRSRNSGIVNTSTACRTERTPSRAPAGTRRATRNGPSRRRSWRRTGQPDEMLRADVRREDRRADDEPPEVAASQEVVLSGVAIVCGRPTMSARPARRSTPE